MGFEHVLCVGDLDVDLFVSVPAIPGFDQKVAGFDHGRMPGGMSANCAVALARLGLRSRLVAAVGDDDDGRFAIESVAADGVDLVHVAHRSATATFKCLVLLSPSGEKSLIRLETDAYLPRVEDLKPEAFDDVGHLHLTFGSPALTFAALSLAAERGIRVSLDLEPPDIQRNPGLVAALLPGVDTLFLNGESFGRLKALLGHAPGAHSLREGGEIVLTMGARGARRIAKGSETSVPGFAVATVDTTGAGDCFAAAYLAGTIRGMSADERLRYANAAAALATLGIGAQTAMPRAAEVETFLSTARARAADTHKEETDA